MERKQKDFTWKAKKIVCHTVANSTDNLYLAATVGAYRGDSWASHTNPLGLKASLQQPHLPARKKGLGDRETPRSDLQLPGDFPESQAVFLCSWDEEEGKKMDCLFSPLVGDFLG